MEIITQEEKDKIVEALKERGVNLPCPRCGNKSFSVVDGYTGLSLVKRDAKTLFGAQYVPTAIVGCSNCGFICQHALGALGLMQKKETE